jgi:hypothetical protein
VAWSGRIGARTKLSSSHAHVRPSACEAGCIASAARETLGRHEIDDPIPSLLKRCRNEAQLLLGLSLRQPLVKKM